MARLIGGRVDARNSPVGRRNSVEHNSGGIDPTCREPIGKLVRTANNDDFSTRKAHLTLDLSVDSTVFVCYWAEATGLPGWLKQDCWKRLNGEVRVRMGSGDKAYNVFARTAPKGRLVLGGNERERTRAASMYFVVTKALR
jgi:hypothetical protein